MDKCVGRIAFFVLAVWICAFIVGCDSQAKTDAAIGAGIGAIAGQAIGGDTEGTLLGAGIGALGGYIIGNEADKGNE
jgi:outer membrane lipoprotein SlyB